VTTPLQADFESIQAHYDLCDEFFALFLDPSRTYSCAKFDTPDTGLAEAQREKVRYTLGKCELRPGMRLLDIGCGWGALATHAHDSFHVNVVGLTLSRNQYRYNQGLTQDRPGLEFRLQGWETFEEPVDRIVSVGAFEHFGRDKYPAFFARCRAILPPDGVLVLHTITLNRPTKSFAFLKFVLFLSKDIFPGGDVPPPERVLAAARDGGFEAVHVESLRPHYERTLRCWADNLTRNMTRAVELVGPKMYRTYQRYLTGCADYFRSGECSVCQFKLRPI
jgi:cyclopropane-fatty-acyl-phospholipid synthase